MAHQISRITHRYLVVLSILAALFLGSVEGSANTDLTREPELFNRCWDFKVNPNLAVLPVIDGTAIFFVDNENKLLALETEGPVRIWSSDLGGEVASNILLSESSIFIATNSQVTEGGPVAKTFLRSISRATGVTEWRVEIQPSANIWIGAYGTSVVSVGGSGYAASLSRSEGKSLWDRNIGSPVTTSPVFGHKAITLGTESNEIFELALADGSVRSLWKSDNLPTSLALDSAGRLVFGDERGNVTAISTNGERSWTFRNGARMSSILVEGSDYIASSNDNFVYRLTRGGNVKWKRRLPARLAQAPLLLADVAVMSVSGSGRVFVVDINKGKILDRIETGEEISLAIGASAGNSGNLIVAGTSGVAYFSREKCPSK